MHSQSYHICLCRNGGYCFESLIAPRSQAEDGGNEDLAKELRRLESFGYRYFLVLVVFWRLLLSVGALLPFLSFAERGVFCAAKQVGFPNSVTLCPNICFLKKLVSSLKKIAILCSVHLQSYHQPCKQEAASQDVRLEKRTWQHCGRKTSELRSWEYASAWPSTAGNII